MRADTLDPFTVVSADGALLRGFRRPGPGPTAVLVHGVAMDTGVWLESGFLGELAGMEVLALDLRGRGGSERVGSARRHAVEHCVADVRAVLDAFPRERYSLFGLYFGGRIALLTAAADARVARAVSFCAHAEEVALPEEAVEAEAAAIEGPGGRAYLRDHFTAAGAPRWMTDACERADLPELAAATRGLRYGSGQAVPPCRPGQELVLVTADQDPGLADFRAGERRLGARLHLVGAPSRIRAAHRLAEAAGQLAGVPEEAG
ncbi:alpha/beta fold hydrolase [Streptomyces orinoci]|uniref:Alpha/beta fold hydrolase n=1 Tax=Streptomyces orinoci TaxID=67339 RepID=A0ABV3K3J0_STRON|nr:alpha/beta fold hydrolase [Streptomyces orinoci]